MARTEGGGDPLGIPGYRNASIIGGGASSTVYRAEDVELTRWVAIKVLLTDDPDDPARKRFKREGTITANLGKHPHIVQVLATGFTDTGTPYVVMELFEQGSIADRLRSSGTFSVAETLDIGVKIADAVSAAHRAGVLHRDIKPQNVLLSEYGPALGDFGIARTAANLEWSQSLDQLTPMHAAPEILLGGTSTAQSDIYSLGSTLYTMLAGRPPFAGPAGEAPLRFQVRVMQDPVPPIARTDVTAAMMAVLEQALAKNPGDRQPSAVDFRDQLQGCVARPSASVAGEDRQPLATSAGTPRSPVDGTGDHAAARRRGGAAPLDEDGATVTRGRSSPGPHGTVGAGASPPSAHEAGPPATDLGDISTILPPGVGIASFLSPVVEPPAPPAQRPAPDGRQPPGAPPIVTGPPAEAAPPGAFVADVPDPDPWVGSAPGNSVRDVDEDALTVHRRLEPVEPEPVAPATSERVPTRRIVLAIAAALVVGLVVVLAIALTQRAPPSVAVKKVGTITTVARDKPTNVDLSAATGGATLRWTDPAGGQLRYLVVEVTPQGNKILGKTAPGKTTLTIHGVDPTTTQYCFEVTAVLSATKVGEPGDWCPTGESVSGG